MIRFEISNEMNIEIVKNIIFYSVTYNYSNYNSF